MVLSIVFLEDKYKMLLHLSIFYEYQQFVQLRFCFSIQPPDYSDPCPTLTRSTSCFFILLFKYFFFLFVSFLFIFCVAVLLISYRYFIFRLFKIFVSLIYQYIKKNYTIKLVAFDIFSSSSNMTFWLHLIVFVQSQLKAFIDIFTGVILIGNYFFSLG